MSQRSLENLLGGTEDTVALLRNSQIGAYVYPVVPSEFSNWRDEQRGWRKTAVLFDQTHHMAEITVRGPDALELMSHLTINSFAGFAPNRPSRWCPAATMVSSSVTASCFILPRTSCCLSGARPRSTGSSFTPKPVATRWT